MINNFFSCLIILLQFVITQSQASDSCLQQKCTEKELKLQLSQHISDLQKTIDSNSFKQEEDTTNPYVWPLMKNVFDFSNKLNLISFLLRTDRYSYGEKIKEFEKEWSLWQGSKYSVMVNSGSSANLILLSAIKEKYNLPSQSKVLVPACTWSTNIAPVIQHGFLPIFCDINFKNFSFEESHLKKISEEHVDVKVVFITHLLGLPANIDLIKNLFPSSILIEDCCEAHGAVYESKKVGSLSEAGTFSFFFGHHMTTIEGGVVSTDDYELYKLLCLKRSHGLARELPVADFLSETQKYTDINPKFLFLTDGYNVRSTEINAVLGLQQLRKLDLFIKERQKNFSIFVEILSHYKELFYIPEEKGNSSFCLPVVTKNKHFFDLFVKNLENNKVEIRPIVGSNLTRQPFLKFLNLSPQDYPNAEIVHHQGIYISNSQFVTKDNFDLLEILIKKSNEEFLSLKV